MDAEAAVPAAPPDTPKWLRDHLPTAERWWRLWLADRHALTVARELALTLTPQRGDRLLADHANAAREASFGYLSELRKAELRAVELSEAHDVREDTPERIRARRALLVDLITEEYDAKEDTPEKVKARRARLVELINEAHDVRPESLDRVRARKARIAELIAELLLETSVVDSGLSP